MSIGPLNAGNMLDVNAGLGVAYSLQMLFAKKSMDSRFYTDGVGSPKENYAINLLAFNLLTNSVVCYFVNRHAPAFKGIFGKIQACHNVWNTVCLSLSLSCFVTIFLLW